MKHRSREDERRAIAEGLQEWRESQIDGTLVKDYRQRMGHIATMPINDDRFKPSLIDRASPYIIAAGVILLMGGSIWAVWRFV